MGQENEPASSSSSPARQENALPVSISFQHPDINAITSRSTSPKTPQAYLNLAPLPEHFLSEHERQVFKDSQTIMKRWTTGVIVCSGLGFLGFASSIVFRRASCFPNKMFPFLFRAPSYVKPPNTSESSAVTDRLVRANLLFRRMAFVSLIVLPWWHVTDLTRTYLATSRGTQYVVQNSRNLPAQTQAQDRFIQYQIRELIRTQEFVLTNTQELCELYQQIYGFVPGQLKVKLLMAKMARNALASNDFKNFGDDEEGKRLLQELVEEGLVSHTKDGVSSQDGMSIG